MKNNNPITNFSTEINSSGNIQVTPDAEEYPSTTSEEKKVGENESTSPISRSKLLLSPAAATAAVRAASAQAAAARAADPDSAFALAAAAPVGVVIPERKKTLTVTGTWGKEQQQQQPLLPGSENAELYSQAENKGGGYFSSSPQLINNSKIAAVSNVNKIF